MPYFCVYAVDKQGTAELRAKWRPEHRQRLREHDHPVTVRIGGPLTDDAGNMIGTMLVIEAERRSDVEAYMAGDHYVKAGLFETLTIAGYNWGLGQPEAKNG